MFLLLKYQKLLTFLVKNPTKKLSYFLGAFIWNNPKTMTIQIEFEELIKYVFEEHVYRTKNNSITS